MGGFDKTGKRLRGVRPRRKRRKKRQRGANVTKGTVVNLARNPIPLSFISKHRYVTTFAVDAGLAVAANYGLKANGIFDPDDAVGGHSALAYDTFKLMYNHYTVLGSQITISATSSANDVGSGATMCYLYINDDAAPITTYNTVIEQGNAVYGILTPSDATAQVTLRKKFSTKEYFSCTDVMDREDLKAGFNDDPSELAHYVFGCQGLVSGSNPAAIYATAVIEYIVKWTEPKDFGQSG